MVKSDCRGNVPKKTHKPQQFPTVLRSHPVKLNWRERRLPPPQQKTAATPGAEVPRAESATKPHPPIDLLAEIERAVDHVSASVEENPGLLEWFRKYDPPALQSIFRQMSLVDTEWERAGADAASRAVKRFAADFDNLLKKYRLATKAT
jgi:hypothetical protein